jgi:adenylate cyclase
MILGHVYLWQKQYEQALAEMERAVAFDPNEANGSANLPIVLSCMGRTKDALEVAARALSLKPRGVVGHLPNVAAVYASAGRPEEPIDLLKQFIVHYPNFLGAHLTLTAAYSELGRDAEAQAEAAEVLRLNPQFSLEVHKERAPIKDPAVLERHMTTLRKAGLK